MKEKAEKKSVDRKLLLKDQSKKKLASSSIKCSSSSRDKDREDSKQSGKTRSGRDKDKDKEKGRTKDKPERGGKKEALTSNNGVTKKSVTVLLKVQRTKKYYIHRKISHTVSVMCSYLLFLFILLLEC